MSTYASPPVCDTILQQCKLGFGVFNSKIVQKLVQNIIQKTIEKIFKR